MAELDIEIDTDLRERAITAVEEFVRDHGTPVSRSQIAGLMQIAANEPRLLAQFAGNQKERAEKRAAGLREGERKVELEAEVAFWERVKLLSEGKGAKCPWSLLQAREAAVPATLKLEKLPPGAALSREDRAKRDQKKRDLEEWERQWNLGHYAGFFRHFCAHYLYRHPPEKR
jgi:hypothetical protein